MEDDRKFCTACGADLSAGTARQPDPQPAQQAYQQTQQQSYQQPVYQQAACQAPPDIKPPKTSRYAVLGFGSYLGMMLLMLIPLANIVFLFIWAFGGKNDNKKNFARAMLVMLVVSIVIGILTSMLVGNLIDKIYDAYLLELTDGQAGDLSELLQLLDQGGLTDMSQLTNP